MPHPLVMKIFPRKLGNRWILWFGTISVPGKAKFVPQMEIEVKPVGKYPWQRHYLLKPETLAARRGHRSNCCSPHQIPKTQAH